jgi:hypothetical protein
MGSPGSFCWCARAISAQRISDGCASTTFPRSCPLWKKTPWSNSIVTRFASLSDARLRCFKFQAMIEIEACLLPSHQHDSEASFVSQHASVSVLDTNHDDELANDSAFFCLPNSTPPKGLHWTKSFRAAKVEPFAPQRRRGSI